MASTTVYLILLRHSPSLNLEPRWWPTTSNVPPVWVPHTPRLQAPTTTSTSFTQGQSSKLRTPSSAHAHPLSHLPNPPFFCFFLFECTCYLCVQVHTHMEGLYEGQCLTLDVFLSRFPPSFLGQGLSLNLDLADSARLACQVHLLNHGLYISTFLCLSFPPSLPSSTLHSLLLTGSHYIALAGLSLAV